MCNKYFKQLHRNGSISTSIFGQVTSSTCYDQFVSLQLSIYRLTEKKPAKNPTKFGGSLGEGGQMSLLKDMK